MDNDSLLALEPYCYCYFFSMLFLFCCTASVYVYVCVCFSHSLQSLAAYTVHSVRGFCRVCSCPLVRSVLRWVRASFVCARRHQRFTSLWRMVVQVLQIIVLLVLCHVGRNGPSLRSPHTCDRHSSALVRHVVQSKLQPLLDRYLTYRHKSTVMNQIKYEANC